MSEATSIIWFKNDLRLHDNETLCKAIAFGAPVLPVFIFDKRLFKTLDLGFKKADYNRFLFLKQSVANLKENLRKIGGELLVLSGKPEEILPKLVLQFNVTTIYTEEEYAYEELQVLHRLTNNIGSRCELDRIWGKTLYHIDDIPYAIADIPATSKAYRINTSKKSKIREPFLAPEAMHIVTPFPESIIPNASDFDFTTIEGSEPYVCGGENAALSRLHYYTFETEGLTNYRWTRNRSLGMDYSSKLSPFLALGCISPRLIYQKVKQYEAIVKKNQSTWWIIFELVWRDYFTFKGMKVQHKMFLTDGFKNKEKSWEANVAIFKRWCDGTTGLPFVDAHMRQLNAHGYMSNRGRVNCASFLIFDYGIDWTWGAAYFESKLIDYDVSANWMNWHYQAYETWYTNPIHQSQKYAAIEFIQKFIPELRHLEDERIYIPWEYDQSKYHKPLEILNKWGRSIQKIKKMIAV